MLPIISGLSVLSVTATEAVSELSVPPVSSATSEATIEISARPFMATEAESELSKLPAIASINSWCSLLQFQRGLQLRLHRCGSIPRRGLQLCLGALQLHLHLSLQALYYTTGLVLHPSPVLPPLHHS